MVEAFRRARAIERVFILLSFGALLIFADLPFYWLLKTSLETESGTVSYPPTLFPSPLSISGYQTVLSQYPVLRWMTNSFEVSVGTTLFCLLTGLPCAFSLSRFRHRGRSAILLTVLTTQMMPPLILIIPLFAIFSRLGLTDSMLGLILGNTAFVLPVVIWMMKSVFDAVPREIDEAAQVDGATLFDTLVRVVIPLAAPGIAAVSIFAFLTCWDEFLLARTLETQPQDWVGTVGLASFVGLYVTPWDQVLAAAALFSLPPLLMFLIVQKQFVAGLGTGAVKG